MGHRNGATMQSGHGEDAECPAIDREFDDWQFAITNAGRNLVAVLRAYFDESERDDLGYLVIAGCLFAGPQLRKFRRQWLRLFAPHGGACHMKDLFAGRGAFEGMPRGEREKLADRAGELVRGRIEHAVGVVVNRQDFSDPTRFPEFPMKKPYAAGCYAASVLMAGWLKQQGRNEGIHYVFESGYTKGGRAEADDHLSVESDFMRWVSRYAGHSFVPKSEAIWLQAADRTAWEMGRHILRQSRNLSETVAARPFLKRLEQTGKLTPFFVRPEELSAMLETADFKSDLQRDYSRFLELTRQPPR